MSDGSIELLSESQRRAKHLLGELEQHVIEMQTHRQESVAQQKQFETGQKALHNAIEAIRCTLTILDASLRIAQDQPQIQGGGHT